MASLTVSILVVLLAHKLQALPTSSGPTIQTIDTNDEDAPTCESIASYYNPICCHYDGVLVPAPRQVDLFEKGKDNYYGSAAKELNDFLPLIQAECHPKLLTLLCFFYFPQCLPTPNQIFTVFPCKSVCEEVTDPDGDCTKLLQRLNIPWADHFNCDNYTYQGEPLYIEERGKCANNSLPRKQCPTRPPSVSPSPSASPSTSPGPSASPSTSASPSPSTSSTPSPGQVATTAEVATTAKVTPATETTTMQPKDVQCSKCDLRSNANGKTFVNNDYNFAVKATFVSQTTHKCRIALNFTLESQYDLKSIEHCTLAPSLPSSFLVLGEHEDCKEVDDLCIRSHDVELEAGKSYLISGHYREDEHGNLCWEVINRSLIALWSSKLESKIDSFISKGNEDRC